MLGRDNVKDEEGYRAVFAKQGTSACQVAAARFLGRGFRAHSGRDDRSSQIVTIAKKKRVLKFGSGILHDKDSWNNIHDPVELLEMN